MCVNLVRMSSVLNNSATVCNSKFYTDVHIDPVYNNTGYDVTSFFRSTFIEIRENGRKWPWAEFLLCSLSEDPEIVHAYRAGTVSQLIQHLSEDMTSGWFVSAVQTAIEYCVYLLKTGPAGNESNKKAHQLVGQWETRRHSSHSDCCI